MTFIRWYSDYFGCASGSRFVCKVFARFSAALFLSLFLVISATFFPPAFHEKAYATQPLTVYVGYSGGPYYEKHVYSASELEALADPCFYAYSAIDKKPSLVKYVAWGVPLETIFSSSVDPIVGTSVNISALWRLAFDTDDDYKPDNGVYGNDRWYWDYYNGYASGHVLNPAVSSRYYFSDFDKYFDFVTESIIASKWDDLAASGVRVPTILALKYVKVRVASEEQWQDLDASLDTNDIPGSLNNAGAVDTRNRLIFGQTSPDEQEVENEVHSVTGLYCIYQGRPTVTLDKTQITGNIGDTVTVRAIVSAVDDLIVAEGPKDVVWTSADESVATVESNGDGTASVTIHGKGDVRITASFGQSSSSEFTTEASANVSGPGGSGWRGEGEGEGWSYGDGDGERGPGTNGAGDSSDDSGVGNEEGDPADELDGGSDASPSDAQEDFENEGNELKPSYTSVPEGARMVISAPSSMEESVSSSEGGSALAEDVLVEDAPQMYRLEQQSEQQQEEPVANLQVPWGYVGPMLLLMLASAAAQVIYFERSKDRIFYEKNAAEAGELSAMAG